MLDRSRRVLYVGKANNLRSRVSSYFFRKGIDAKTRKLMEKADKVDFIVTGNETEALILEDNLIKKHLPRYNINLKDDKHYPFIRVTSSSDDFPRLLIARERGKEGDLYLGPYTDARSVRNILKMINRLFPLRKCAKKLAAKEKDGLFLRPEGRPCLNFQLKQCLAPCQGGVSPAEYRKLAGQAVLFLKGGSGELIGALRREMRNSSKRLDYEKAGLLRDRIRALEHIAGEQKVSTGGSLAGDILSLTEQADIFNVTVLMLRKGNLVGKNNFFFRGKGGGKEEVLNEFVKRHYINRASLPDEIILPFPVEDSALLEKYFSSGKKTALRMPSGSLEKKLMSMAEENGRIELDQYLRGRRPRGTSPAAAGLKKELKLNHAPRVIEGFDISHIAGCQAVGSMVRFRQGVPDRTEYRRFRIRSVEGIDDPAMMGEVVYRRFRRLREEGRALPDLVLVDGGKAQLASALSCLKQLGLPGLPVVSLAKKEEEIYLPLGREPLRLPCSHPGLKLLQRIRDEAHRFALAYHKKARAKEFLPREKNRRRVKA